MTSSLVIKPMSYIRPEVYKKIEENNINDVVFEDPFKEETRKAKRNIIASSFIALLIATLDLQISGFLGLQTTTGSSLGGAITKGLIFIVVTYFLAAFVLAAYVDYSAWKFRRERYLVEPYLELIRMLEAHVQVLGEQMTNATSRLSGIVIEHNMQSQVSFQQAIKEASGQLKSIHENGIVLYQEMRPLIDHWSAMVKKAEGLSWRLRARFLSLWVLDIAVPIALAALAIWKTCGSVPFVWSKIAG